MQIQLFLNFLSKTKLNQFNQVFVSQEVLIFITADGCAFYSISLSTQPLFLVFLFYLTRMFIL